MTDPKGGFGSFGGGQSARDSNLGRTGNGGHQPGRILTGADFIADHVPPVWLIDGIVQRSRLYACTSLTGHGKTAVWLFIACMIHAGRMIGHLDAFRGNVLILAGENPSDLKARMIGMAKAFNIPLDRLPYVLPGSFPMTEEGAEALKRDIAALGVPLVLIIGDTAASFFPGDDENDNVQAGNYGRILRTFNEDCDGHPAVVALCHPIKGAKSKADLLPRGGGALLNELDGNLTLWSQSQGEVTEMHWHGKIRGPDFSPLGFRLRQVATGLIDEKDRAEITIIAEPMSEEAVADHHKQTLANEDAVLKAMRDHPEWSMGQIAKEIGWVNDTGEPMKARVHRTIGRLAIDKLVTQERHGGSWTITTKGEEAVAQRYAPPEAEEAIADKPTERDRPPLQPAPPPPTKEEIAAVIADYLKLDEGERALQRVPTAVKLADMPLGVFDALVRAALKAAAPPAQAKASAKARKTATTRRKNPAPKAAP